jgi:hypothetical protein
VFLPGTGWSSGRKRGESPVPVLQLVFSVCSILEGATCNVLPPIPLQQGTTLIGCAVASQIEGAKWIAAHPNHYIQKATCEPAGRFARI